MEPHPIPSHRIGRQTPLSTKIPCCPSTHLPPLRSCPQVVLVSATLPQEVLEMTTKFMTDPVRVLVKRDELTLEVWGGQACGGCSKRGGCSRYIEESHSDSTTL